MKRIPYAEKKEWPAATILLIIVAVVFLLSLFPLLSIAKYDFPVGDDLLYSASTAKAYQQTGAFGDALAAASDMVKQTYKSWQGTYSAIFLMALQPGAFSLSSYSLTPTILLLSLILSTLVCSYVVLVCCLNVAKRNWLLLALTMLFFSIQLPPSAREAFYWYNGGIYYTFFHSLMLLLFSALLMGCRAEKTLQKLLWAALSGLLAVIVAGGNYATALPCAVLLAVFAVCCTVREKRIDAIISYTVLLLFMAGMLISVLAPGNTIRAEEAAVNGYVATNPIKAILLSFVFAAAAFVNRFDTAAILLILLTAGLAVPALKSSSLRFRFPLLVILFAFCVFACQFTPTAFAAASPGPYRLRNLVFWNYYWMLGFDTVYLTGWLIKRKEEGTRHDLLNKLVRFFRVYPVALILAAALLTGSALLQRNILNATTVMAVRELGDGTAARYGTYRYAALLGVTLDAPRQSELLS